MERSLQETLSRIERLKANLERMSMRHFENTPLTMFEAALRIIKGGVPTPKELEELEAHLKNHALWED